MHLLRSEWALHPQTLPSISRVVKRQCLKHGMSHSEQLMGRLQRGKLTMVVAFMWPKTSQEQVGDYVTTTQARYRQFRGENNNVPHQSAQILQRASDYDATRLPSLIDSTGGNIHERHTYHIRIETSGLSDIASNRFELTWSANRTNPASSASDNGLNSISCHGLIRASSAPIIF